MFAEENISGNHFEETALIQKAATEIKNYLCGRLRVFSVPINPYGSDFMKQVWNELQKIPYGKTKSYKDIAVAIGNKKAYRAVGLANHKNPIPIIIPCHRVIGANGNLTGYAGGISIKEKLLKLEDKFRA